MTCRPGSHRCAALALWFLDNALALRIAADCERQLAREFSKERECLPIAMDEVFLAGVEWARKQEADNAD